ncbi:MULTISPECIES: hypothetical protein [unclassified Pseudomonas]|uniref:hypothetical protein n=1 Tax=unclassified Pseudomonas TaxID=196821 RepID=UPI001475FD27|nr:MULTISPECIES: hypothetical protein [unclassified Pseudomonas]NMX94405.1 hypothetical protein [Pseudomonas sp. WS 5086]NMY47891.1 hypothetical protein [Pseudomonas sp. WS 5027]
MSISSNNHPINSAGAPDLSFGNSPTKNGTVIARHSGGLSRTLSDGSTITVGLESVETKTRIVVTKHTPAGEQDLNFVTFPQDTDKRTILVRLTIQPDGKPLLLTARGLESTAFITRFNAHNGDTDKLFGVAGTRDLGKKIYTGFLPRGGLAVQADNKIVSVFHDGTHSFIFQLSASGELINFGRIGPIDSKSTLLNTLLITSRGFVIAGARTEAETKANAKAPIRKTFMMGFLHDAELDSSFGNGGFVELQFSNNENKQISALAKGPDGQIAVVGGDSNLPSKMNFVASLLANGQANPQFHGGKPLETDDIINSYTDVVTQNDGKIVALARTDNGNRVLLFRHTLTGQLDPSFGEQGRATAWQDPQGRPERSYIDTLELVQPGEKLQSSGVLRIYSESFIGRLLSQ